MKVAGAFLALSLIRPWGARIRRRFLLVAAVAGSLVLIVYGSATVVVGGLVLAGVITPSEPVDEHALGWLCSCDLWFLVWGAALAIAAWSSYREPRSSPR